jgi:hypothetical protein
MQIYIVSIKSAGRGSYILGHVVSESKEGAQKIVFELLVESGVPEHRIGQQVTDNTTLHIGTHEISITPLAELTLARAAALVALM